MGNGAHMVSSHILFVESILPTQLSVLRDTVIPDDKGAWPPCVQVVGELPEEHLHIGDVLRLKGAKWAKGTSGEKCVNSTHKILTPHTCTQVHAHTHNAYRYLHHAHTHAHTLAALIASH